MPKKTPSSLLRANDLLRPVFSDYGVFAVPSQISETEGDLIKFYQQQHQNRQQQNRNHHQHQQRPIPRRRPSRQNLICPPSSCLLGPLTTNVVRRNVPKPRCPYDFNIHELWANQTTCCCKLHDSRVSIRSSAGKDRSKSIENDTWRKVSGISIVASSKRSTPKKSESPLTDVPDSCKSLSIQRSVPIFELLPPLMTTSKQRLLYQNSILLDGMEYRSGGNGVEKKATLQMDFDKFSKSLIGYQKPTDGDIIFGNAKTMLISTCGWENSRIQWLNELERKRQPRKQRRKVQNKLEGNDRKSNAKPKDLFGNSDNDKEKLQSTARPLHFADDDDNDVDFPVICCLPFFNCKKIFRMAHTT